ncbi:MAG: FHA domain-containing protein [Victivallales bacterium]|nr:FHA domain-containing protein [Victivallales bacterium]
MKYAIKFITGSRSGQTFELKPDCALTIGRSSSMQVVLDEGDVSSRHVSITTNGFGTSIVLEVFSSHRNTSVDGYGYNMNDSVELAPGNVIKLGRDVQFTLISLADAPAMNNAPASNAAMQGGASAQSSAPAAAVSSNAKTINSPAAVPNAVQAGAGAPSSSAVTENSPVSPNAKASFNLPKAPAQPAVLQMPAQSAAVNQMPNVSAVPRAASNPVRNAGKTEATGTIGVSPEEMKRIENEYSAKERRRLLLWVVGAALFFALMVTMYMTLRPAREEIVTWPTDANGDELAQVVQTAPYLASLVPKVGGMKIQNEGGNAEVYTRIGKLRDVLLHVVISTWKSKDELKLDRSQSFAGWLASMRQKNPDMNFNGTGRVEFISVSEGAGVPVTVESYTRRVGNDDFFGYLGYLRHGENVHLTMVEVPLAEQWRAEPLLRERLCTNFILYAIRLTPEWWDGTSRLREGASIEEDLEEAGRYLRREAPAFWEKIHYLTKSALVKAALQDNTEAQAKALDLLKQLRTAQASWYNTQKLAYQYAKKSENKETMRSIQSICESIFSSEFQEDDYRYDYIRRKNWQ